jgi:hypothetical protein
MKRLLSFLLSAPLLLVAMVVCGSSMSAEAQGVFCVRAGATGSGSGSDWNNAYASLPATLQRGATYYVADGAYAGYMFDDAESGTTVITIKKATVADHGTSAGWSNAYGDGTATFNGSLNFARDYYVVNGVTRNESAWKSQVYGFRVVGSVSSWPLNFPPGGDHISVSYLDVGGTVGTAYGDAGFNNNEATYFVNNSGTSFDFTVSHCFFHNCTLSQNSGIDTVVFEYCYFWDMWAKECIRGQDECKNGIIRYCMFQDTTRDTGLPGETGTAPIAIWDGGAGAFDNWKIYGNVFWDTRTIAHSGGCILVGGNGGGWVGSPASNVKIYNNTIVNFLGSYSADILINGGTGNEVRNTLWYNCIGTPSASPNTSNNGEQTSNPFVNSAGFNFRLSAALPGTILPTPYNADIDGVIRGTDGTFDRGAFEFNSGPDVPPAAPNNLRIVTGN